MLGHHEPRRTSEIKTLYPPHRLEESREQLGLLEELDHLGLNWNEVLGENSGMQIDQLAAAVRQQRRENRNLMKGMRKRSNHF